MFESDRSDGNLVALGNLRAPKRGPIVAPGVAFAVLLAGSAFGQVQLGGFPPVALSPQPVPAMVSEEGVPQQPTRGHVPTRIAITDPGPLGLEETSGNASQVVWGGGFTTNIIVTNIGSDPTSGELVVTQSDGDPAQANFTGSGTVSEPDGRLEAVGSSFSFTLNPGGTQFVGIGPVNPEDGASVGWLTMITEGGMANGVASFDFRANGVLTTSVGILFSQPVTSVTIPIDNSEAEERFVGVAVAVPGPASTNPTQDIALQMSILQEDGMLVENFMPSEFVLGAGQQRAIFFHQIRASLLTFRGAVALVSLDGTPFIVAALVQNGIAQPIFSATPAIEGVAPVVPQQ